MARDRGRRRPRRGALAVVGLASLACLSLPLSSVAPALAASVSPAASTTPLDSFSGVTPTAWLMSQDRDAARASTAWPDYDLAFGAEDEVPAPGAPLPASEDLSNLTPEQLLNLLVARSIAVGTPEALASRYISPVPGPITSAFGPRFHPILHFVRNHNGVDMTAACGTPVVAIADGVVSRSGAAGGYGNLVEVNHGKVDGDTMASRYAHLSVIGVPLGARVSKGQQIGLAGTTGLSTGCHLHFEVLINGAYVNPAAVLSGAPHVRLDTPMVPGLATPPVPGGRIPVAPPHEPHPLPDLPPLTPAPSGTPLPPATPSPEPSHTPTPEPSVTPTPEPSVTPTPTPTPEPSVTPTPTPEPSTTPTPTPEPSVTPTPSGTPEPSATPTTSGSATPSGTPTQSDSPTPEASASPTP